MIPAILSAILAKLAEDAIEAALEASKLEAEAKGIQIVNLSQRLNAALVSKVQELASFRLEFFGRLRQMLGRRGDVRIVGDRLVFQSEVLLPSGQATLQACGRGQIDTLGETIDEISVKIPADIDWVLRVDGHNDRIPISPPAYPSNWDLSTGRAVAVVKYLIERIVPAIRFVATGFGEFQPIKKGNTIAVFRRNHRMGAAVGAECIDGVVEEVDVVVPQERDRGDHRERGLDPLEPQEPGKDSPVEARRQRGFEHKRDDEKQDQELADLLPVEV